MPEKMEKGKMCAPCMCTSCSLLSGVLATVAGGALLMFSLGSLEVMQAHLIGGGALTLYGLGALIHSAGMCPMCR